MIQQNVLPIKVSETPRSSTTKFAMVASMSESSKTQSLRDQQSAIDVDEKRERIMNKIQVDFKSHGQFRTTQTNQRNILFIGRCRAGKSTVKSLIIDPTIVPEDLSLRAGTREPSFESFHVSDNRMVLNFIDTPGLFEHGTREISVRDNQTILNTIEACANRALTNFHVICFCITITVGVIQQDIESLKLLINFLGENISTNSCLIITRCESKDEEQRKKIHDELLEDNFFQEIASFFKLGIFFSGSLNRDDYKRGNESLYEQFITISDYRNKLIELFTSNIEPIPISEMLISDVRRFRDKAEQSSLLANMAALSIEQQTLTQQSTVADQQTVVEVQPPAVEQQPVVEVQPPPVEQQPVVEVQPPAVEQQPVVVEQHPAVVEQQPVEVEQPAVAQ